MHQGIIVITTETSDVEKEFSKPSCQTKRHGHGKGDECHVRGRETPKFELEHFRLIYDGAIYFRINAAIRAFNGDPRGGTI